MNDTDKIKATKILRLYSHPDKNIGCSDLSKDKFQIYSEKCEIKKKT